MARHERVFLCLCTRRLVLLKLYINEVKSKLLSDKYRGVQVTEK